MSDYEKLAQQHEDDDTYDTEADNESEKLESAIEKEKSSQTKQKAVHRAVTEAREKRTIVSHRERTEMFVQLATQLSHSEKNEWHNQY